VTVPSLKLKTSGWRQIVRDRQGVGSRESVSSAIGASVGLCNLQPASSMIPCGRIPPARERDGGVEDAAQREACPNDERRGFGAGTVTQPAELVGEVGGTKALTIKS